MLPLLVASIIRWYAHLGEAVVNIAVFLPYFFSVSRLMKTLFAPWKNIMSEEKKLGFSFSALFDKLSFNLVSRSIGFFMRISLLMFYVIVQFIFIVSVPLVFIIATVLFPLSYIGSLLRDPPEKKKEALKQAFVSAHLLNEANLQVVSEWFELYYQQSYQKPAWWKITSLFSIPPLARDWAVGYTPELDEYTEDLSSTPHQSALRVIVGRDKEVEEVERGLLKTTGANVILTGEEGVGKHTIIDSFAKKVYEGSTNPLLMYKRILKLNMEKVLTEFTDQKQRERFFERLLNEAEKAKNIILVIDDFDKFVTFAENRVDLTVPFEKISRNSHVQIIGVTTSFAYQRYIVPNEKIIRFFQKVDVPEVSSHNTRIILLHFFELFERRYGLTIPYETIYAVIRKSEYYITTAPFPEKAIELLDACCVYTKEKKKESSVLPEVVDIVLSETTHIQTTLTDDFKKKLLDLEELMRTKILHQDKALSALSSALRRAFLLMGKRKKPLATFLFLGPTGIGKTQTAKALNEIFFGSETSLLRLDMSTYQSQTDIEKLIGSRSTGFPGELTAQVRKSPYGVLLLDELEKAHKQLLNIFLSVLDEGYFTDGFGKRVDCKNLIIIATSNAGSELIFENKVQTTESLINTLVEKGSFSPEFLNRFDGIVFFDKLDQQSILDVAQMMTKEIVKDIYRLHKVHLVVTPTYLQQLIPATYDERFGVRQMERILRSKLEDEVAKLILQNKIAPEGSYTV